MREGERTVVVEEEVFGLKREGGGEKAMVNFFFFS